MSVGSSAKRCWRSWRTCGSQSAWGHSEVMRQGRISPSLPSEFCSEVRDSGVMATSWRRVVAMSGVALFDDGPEDGIRISPERSCGAGWHGMALPGGSRDVAAARWMVQAIIGGNSVPLDLVDWLRIQDLERPDRL